jgi:hypothetical protein
MGTVLTPILSVTPGTSPNYNVGMAETFSWIPVDNNVNRPLYARANYIVNLADLSISLSASDINIGGVEIIDGTNNAIRATVTQDVVNGNSLQVQTQDLESSIDDISIGDKQGHYADVNSTLSALNVYPVVPSGGYTLCDTRTSGYPTFTSKEILIHNSTNSDVNVTLTLTSGLSCRVPIGKSTEPNHILRLNVAVSAVNIYSGCEITFFG